MADRDDTPFEPRDDASAQPVLPSAEPVSAEPVAAEAVPVSAVSAEPVTAEPVTPEPVVDGAAASGPVELTPVAAEPVTAEPDTAESDTADRVAPPAARRGSGAAMVSLRVARGLVGLGAAAALVAGAALLPAPSVSIAPLATTVDPEPAPLVRTCVGALQRLGDPTGADASRTFAVGAPQVTDVAIGGEAERLPTGDGTTLRLAPADGAALGGAQAQLVRGDADLAGLATASCLEPASSAWLVGGVNATGRTTLLVLTNPSEVAADVTVRMWGENGAVNAPGMSGIRVAAGEQRVIPLAGWAPELASPVVRVTARGGQIVASLQTSVIRVLDPGGVDIATPGAAPSTRVVVPSVRILDSAGVSGALGRFDHEDLDAIARIGNTGSEDADVEISVRPVGDSGLGTSFRVDVPAGRVADVSLAAALALGEGPLPDGVYTVTFTSEVPIVAGVRVATTPPGDTGPVDIAWFASATALRTDTLLAAASAPSPVLVVDNDGDADRVVVLERQDGGAATELLVPAGSSAAASLRSGTGYLLRDVQGLRAGVSYAASGAVSGQTVRAPRQTESSIVIRP